MAKSSPSAAGDTPTVITDISATEQSILQRVSPFTMTSEERLVTLLRAVRYTVEHNLPGDIVECGVWRGGSMMAIALMLIELKAANRPLHLFDTFEGMPPSTEADVNLFSESAQELSEVDHRDDGVKCYASLDEVRANLATTDYPPHLLHFHEGKVEDTIPGCAPNQIALLRLDTDWYESTRHELAHLYPRLCEWGGLIIDDYGHWQGARQAVDEYLVQLPQPTFLHRVDYTARMLIKPGPSLPTSV